MDLYLARARARARAHGPSRKRWGLLALLTEKGSMRPDWRARVFFRGLFVRGFREHSCRVAFLISAKFNIFKAFRGLKLVNRVLGGYF